MSQTRNQQAYQRGIRVARMWKRLKGTILRWDHRCVSKARNYRLPGWVGHVPTAFVTIGFIFFLIGYALVSLAGISCVLAMWAITYIAKNIFRPTPVEITNWNENKKLEKSSFERFSWENEQHKNTYDRQSWHQND
ncbi:hypothetical protein JEM67_02230 [Serratia sp. PAMC26656]|uniref:hypothetical protein n=1 Tax=Serratia sp. PAMC26656 TaxID=2775909 RepID=UPI0018F45514|nr:hypothetical protein [Serratia sp. PAMC26656]MBJ7893342.1 hypothetical protein [Serratia sp. PAMC26656]